MGTKTFYVTVFCQAVYNSSIEVPEDYTYEEALEYTEEHIDEISIYDELEYVDGSDELDIDNCGFGDE